MLSLVLVVAETPQPALRTFAQAMEENPTVAAIDGDNASPDFQSFTDPAFVQYLDDSVYASLEALLPEDSYSVQGVHTLYVSQEYLDELAYNSQSNIFFGYTLAELDEQFDGTRYVFTLGDDGQTVVRAFEAYDDTFDRIIENVAIGTGVIITCAIVEVATAGTVTPLFILFAGSAKTAAEFAISGAVIGGVISGAVTGYKTKDFDQAIKAAGLAASEGFKWGAISGALYRIGWNDYKYRWLNEFEQGVGASAKAIPSAREAEIAALEKYGGEEQVSFILGEKAAFGAPGSTRPDIVRTIDGHLEAIEVKCYDLQNNSGVLLSSLEKEVSSRVANLPAGSTQRIVLNVQGRGYSEQFVEGVVNRVQTHLDPIYRDIPVDIMW